MLFLLFLVPQASAQEFSDVYEKHLNREAIDFLQEEAVIEGYEDGSYKPENRINRAEFTKIIMEAIYSDTEIEACSGSEFPDVPAGEWFAKYVCKAAQENIIGGYPDGTFNPAGFINFAEASKIVAEAKDVTKKDLTLTQEWFEPYVKGLEERSAIPSTISFFDSEITRGEMAELVWRLEADKKDEISVSYDEITNPFPAIASCEALEEKLTTFNHYPQYRNFGMVDDMMFMEMEESSAESLAVPTLASVKSSDSAADSAGAGGANDFSQTNIQVAGVDEADIIKNDGQYVYLIKEDEIRIVKAYPGDEMEEVSTINFDEEGFYPNEMYVTDNRLVVVGRANHYYYAKPFLAEPGIAVDFIAPPFYQSDQSKVFVFDITDRSNPTMEREVAFDGNYHTSRRIGDQVYLVLNAHPNVWNYAEAKSGEDFLPMFKDGENEAEEMVGCTDIRYFPGHRVPQYLITASIDISDDESEIKRNVYLGSSDNVYSSRTHLYVATAVHSFEHFNDWDWSRDQTKTHVFRFALDDGEIEFKARGKVPGTILNQFSMDAHIDHFRIATTKGNMWDERNPSSNNVYVLDQEMEVVGTLEDLAPGERIFSTRFLGDRLYMVTFRQVDPLFVIDLKDPKNPEVLGKLKIPGFSDYLHPFDEDHIIGFGKETVEEKDRVLVDGFKMSLFDVSDVTDPKQKFVEVIGDRGTYCELLNNHKALLFDKEKELLAFPIQIQEFDEELGYTQTSFSGAVVYKLNAEDGFEELAKLTHYSDIDMLKMGDFWPYDFEKNIQRILYIGEYLYSVAQGGIKSHELDSLEAVEFLELED